MSYLRWAWGWLRYLGREKPEWYYGEDQIAFQGVDYDEEASEFSSRSAERASLGCAARMTPANGGLPEAERTACPLRA